MEFSSFVGNNDLFRVLVECNISRSSKDKILNVLRNYTNPFDIHLLPRTFKTAVGKYPEFLVENIDQESENCSNEESEGEEYYQPKSSSEREETEDESEKSENESTATPVKPPLSHFIYFGLQNSMQSGVAKFNEHHLELYLSINIDGVQLHNRSRKCFWPILGHFDGGNVFPIALYCGLGKPKSNNAFLKKFVEEMQTIYLNGVRVNGKEYKVHLWAGIFDSPARCWILNMPYFNSYEGCYHCEGVGTYENRRMCFLEIDAPLRCIERDTCQSLLFKIIDPKAIPIDVMHVVHLGVMRKLIALWTTSSSMFSLTPSLKKILSARLENFEKLFPKEFNRAPRAISEVVHYTAKEYRAILLYAGPVIFQDILPRHQYLHFLSLHVACRILNNDSAIRDAQMLDYCETLLRNFVTDFSTVYSRDLVSSVVHVLIHLVNDVRRLQKPVIKFSAYPFENFNRILKYLVKSSKSPGIQVARRIYEWTVFQTLTSEPSVPYVGLHKKIVGNTKVYSACQTADYYFDNTFRNRFCQIGSRIFMVHHFYYHDDCHQQPHVRGTFIDSIVQVEELYSIPCSSFSVDISTASLHKTSFKIEPTSEHPVADIEGKYVGLPMGSSHQYAFIKML